MNVECRGSVELETGILEGSRFFVKKVPVSLLKTTNPRNVKT